MLLIRRAPVQLLHSFPTRRSSDLRETSGLPRTEPAQPAGSSGRGLLGRVDHVLSNTQGGTSRTTLVKYIREVPPCVLERDRKSTRLNSSHLGISYAVFCLKKKRR